MGYQADLLRGVAQLLDDAGVGSWDESGVYPAEAIGIVLGPLAQTPDNQVALSTYPVADDPANSDTVTGLQVLTRAAGMNPTATADLTDAVFNALHGLHDHTLPTGVRVVYSVRRSGTSLGVDGDGRHRDSSNYYVTTHRASPHRE